MREGTLPRFLLDVAAVISLVVGGEWLTTSVFHVFAPADMTRVVTHALIAALAFASVRGLAARGRHA